VYASNIPTHSSSSRRGVGARDGLRAPWFFLPPAESRGSAALSHQRVDVCRCANGLSLGPRPLPPGDRARPTRSSARPVSVRLLKIGHSEIERFAGNMLETRHLGRSAWRFPGAGNVGSRPGKDLRPDNFARPVRVHGCRTRGSGPRDREARGRQRSLHARRSVSCGRLSSDMQTMEVIKSHPQLSAGIGRRRPRGRPLAWWRRYSTTRQRQCRGHQCPCGPRARRSRSGSCLIDIGKGWVATRGRGAISTRPNPMAGSPRAVRDSRSYWVMFYFRFGMVFRGRQREVATLVWRPRWGSRSVAVVADAGHPGWSP